MMIGEHTSCDFHLGFVLWLRIWFLFVNARCVHENHDVALFWGESLQILIRDTRFTALLSFSTAGLISCVLVLLSTKQRMLTSSTIIVGFCLSLLLVFEFLREAHAHSWLLSLLSESPSLCPCLSLVLFHHLLLDTPAFFGLLFAWCYFYPFTSVYLCHI